MTYNIGDPDHIGVHDRLRTDVGSLADLMGVDVILPPQRNLGDLGHTDDHNTIQAAIDKIAAGAVPGLNPAPIIDGQVNSLDGPDVQEWLVKDKQGKRKLVYLLPGNTGTVRSLALTDEGAEALAARRDVLDAIATTDVPDDYDGDPVTLLPKKLRAELKGFVQVRDRRHPEATYSVTLGAGVFPGVIVGSGGPGGYENSGNPSICGGGGGAGGVIGQGAHVPVILPVQGTATYTITVGSTSYVYNLNTVYLYGQSSTIAVQGQTPFAAAVGGGGGFCYRGSAYIQAYPGASGGGGTVNDVNASQDRPYMDRASGIPGQGHDGGRAVWGYSGGGGGYSAPGEGSQKPYPGGNTGAAGGAGFDLATALNLDANDSLTGSLLNQVSVDGRIAGGGSTTTTDSIDGGGARNGDAKDWSGGGGGGGHNGNDGGAGAAGMALIITDAP